LAPLIPNHLFHLRHITLLEELLLLKEYEKRETTLSDRVMSKRTELAELNGRVRLACLVLISAAVQSIMAERN